MDSVVDEIKLGMIGISKGNGHPFSFASIINGFNNEEMKNSGWDIIYNYLRERDKSEFGFNKVKITHVWTQDRVQSEKLARATKIQNIVENIEDMIDKVDGVIIARDDYQNHFKMSKRFLESNKFVFMDKPLSLNVKELLFFKEYLEKGKLMSCSGVRYAKELDEIRANINNFGDLKLIRGTVVNSLEKYGIHMLDGIFGVINFQVESVMCTQAKHASLLLKNKDKSLIYIDALGEAPKTFQFDFWSQKKRFHAEINDNFSMFRRTMFHFINMIRTKKPSIAPSQVINIMKVLIAANISQNENRMVRLDEIIV